MQHAATLFVDVNEVLLGQVSVCYGYQVIHYARYSRRLFLDGLGVKGRIDAGQILQKEFCVPVRLKVLVYSSVPIFVRDKGGESNEFKDFSKLKANRLNRCCLV